MRATVLELALEPGASEAELAERYAERVASFMPYLGPMVENMLRLHLRQTVRTEAISATERAGRCAARATWWSRFADLVGFTRLGEEVPPEELGDVADRLVGWRARREPPVRLVKTIGDAVMLVSPEPAPLDAALDLVDAPGRGRAIPAAARRDRQRPRDEPHGRLVRAPGEHRQPGDRHRPARSVLATREVRDAAPDAARWSAAGARTIKGVPGPVRLYRARPPAARRRRHRRLELARRRRRAAIAPGRGAAGGRRRRRTDGARASPARRARRPRS